MPADPLSDDIAGLLHVLEEFERSIVERRISTDRQPAKLHDEAQPKMAAFATAVDRSENRLVERIAAAMSKSFEFKPV
jgi:anti-sigma-K factor RskA